MEPIIGQQKPKYLKEQVRKSNFLTAKSQIAAVPSVDPVANIVPCGENRTSLTAYV